MKVPLVKDLVRSMRQRTIVVNISPTPINFAERRSVLQVLEQQGPVEVFKKRAGTYGSYVAVTKDVASAERLVASSPLAYEISSQSSNTIGRAGGRSSSSSESSDTSHPAVVSAPSEVGSAVTRSQGNGIASEEEKRRFELNIQAATGYRHEKAIAQSSPLSKPWPASYEQDRSFMAATLKQALPDTVAAKGLAHWLFEGAYDSKKAAQDRMNLKAMRPGLMKTSRREPKQNDSRTSSPARERDTSGRG